MLCFLVFLDTFSHEKGWMTMNSKCFVKLANGILLIALLVGCLFALTGCGSNAPEDQLLKNSIPDNVMNFELSTNGEDEKNYRSNIESFKVTRRKTENGRDYAEADVVLAHEKITRKLKLAFTTNYYDVGGWQVDNVSVLSAQVTKAEAFSPDILRDYFVKKGYTLQKDDLRIMNLGKTEYTAYLPTQEFTNATVSGSLSAEATLEFVKREKKAMFGGTVTSYEDATQIINNPTLPMEFVLNTSYDETGVKYDWHPTGSWYAKTAERNCDYYVYVTLDGIENNMLHATIEAKYDTIYGDIGTYDVHDQKRAINWSHVPDSLSEGEAYTRSLESELSAGYPPLFTVIIGVDRVWLFPNYNFYEMQRID